MTQTVGMEQLQAMRGAPVYSQEGEEIGSVEELFLDYETDRPEWVGVGTGMLGTKRVLVPVEGATLEGDGLRVPYAKDQVKGSPDIDSDEISQETEQELAAYYGVGYSEQRSGSGLPEGGQAVDDVRGEASVTRSEEELRVGTETVDRGTARLRKWVETEPVTMDVHLTQETARVSREPVEQPVADAAIGEQEVEVQLRGERPVVEKQTVAKERITLEKDVETETSTVSDELRREQVEIEGGDAHQ